MPALVEQWDLGSPNQRAEPNAFAASSRESLCVAASGIGGNAGADP